MRMNIIKWDESIYYRYIHRFPCLVHKKSSSSQGCKAKDTPTAAWKDSPPDIKTDKNSSGGQTEDTDMYAEKKCCMENMSSGSSTASQAETNTYQTCEQDSFHGIGVGQIIECDVIYGCISDL